MHRFFIVSVASFVATGCAANRAGPAVSHDHPASTDATSQPSAVAAYVCPMHPEVTSNAPGKCPKCGMKLVAKGGE